MPENAAFRRLRLPRLPASYPRAHRQYRSWNRDARGLLSRILGLELAADRQYPDEIDLPAVITADLRLNEPRYVKLPDIMKAKKKPLDEIALDDLGIELAPALTNVSFEPPAERSKGVMVEDVAGLVAALKDKGLL